MLTAALITIIVLALLFDFIRFSQRQLPAQSLRAL
jgi:hypothetical protein